MVAERQQQAAAATEAGRLPRASQAPRLSPPQRAGQRPPPLGPGWRGDRPARGERLFEQIPGWDWAAAAAEIGPSAAWFDDGDSYGFELPPDDDEEWIGGLAGRGEPGAGRPASQWSSPPAQADSDDEWQEEFISAGQHRPEVALPSTGRGGAGEEGPRGPQVSAPCPLGGVLGRRGQESPRTQPPGSTSSVGGVRGQPAAKNQAQGGRSVTGAGPPARAHSDRLAPKGASTRRRLGRR